MSSERKRLLDRLSTSRPGYRLIDVIDSAIPVFSVRADVLLIERRPIGPIDEFVLKSIDQGLNTPAEIHSLLGLEKALVLETLVELQRNDYVTQRGEHRELILTERGNVLLDEKLREAPTREQAWIGFDRLAWKVTAEAQQTLMRPAELEASGRSEIPPRLKRRVTIKDLDIDEIGRVVRSIRARSEKPTVLGVDRIIRANRFYLPADLAIFESIAGGDAQVSVLVDGRPSPKHESEIEKNGGLDFIGGALASEQADPMESLREDYGPAVAKDLAQSAPSAAEKEADPNERVTAAPMEGVSTGTADASPPPSDSPPTDVQFIDTFEHREYLDRALSETQHRLVIISPWITSNVVNRGFQERLLQLLRRGVHVHIGYGLEQRPGDRKVSRADLAAESALVKMSERWEDFVLVKLGNTHSKQLLFDDTHVSGSFNWLSFQGNRSREYRHEESTVVRIKRKVDAKYEDLCERLERTLADR